MRVIMYSSDKPKVVEADFNKALRLVMAEFKISGVDLAEKSKLSLNSISRAKNDNELKAGTINKISQGLAQIDIEAYQRFWQIVSGCDLVIR